MSILEIVLLISFLICLVVVRSFRLPAVSISQFELRRRVALLDDVALSAERVQSALPRLLGLKNILRIVLSTVIVALCIAIFGWWQGALLAILLLLIVDIISLSKRSRDIVRSLHAPHENRCIDFVNSYKWLSWFAPSFQVPVKKHIGSREELRQLIEGSKHVLIPFEKKYLLSSLSFAATKVSDIMTPKTMIESIDISDGIGPLVLDSLHKTGHSRFPVIKGDVDHVVGMLHLHDLITLKSSHGSVKDAMRSEVYYVHQDQDLKHALHAFLRTHHHLFIVVNTFRETVGLLSLEDVIESMIGSEVVDEFDEFHDLRKVAETNPRSNNEPKGKNDI